MGFVVRVGGSWGLGLDIRGCVSLLRVAGGLLFVIQGERYVLVVLWRISCRSCAFMMLSLL